MRKVNTGIDIYIYMTYMTCMYAKKMHIYLYIYMKRLYDLYIQYVYVDTVKY